MDQEIKQFIQAENEKLATMVAGGFAHVYEKMAAKDDIIRVENRLDNMDARLGRMEADIGALRGEIVYRHEFEDALGRIKYLEKKLGIESGVSL
jgi:hypothetical protein